MFPALDMLRAPIPLAVVTSLALLVTPARGDDCAPATGESTCFDADSLWLRATSDRFVSVDRARIPDPGAFVVAGATIYAARPVVAVAASPDPEGREIHVVESRLGISLLAAIVPFRNAEIDLAVPFVLFQDGTGLGGITTRGDGDLRATAPGDPRVGFAYGVPFAQDRLSGAVKASLDFALPLGDEDNFAGESGVVVAPGLAAEMEAGRFFAGLHLDARLRRTVTFAGARLGPDLGLSAGAGAHVLERSLLSVGAEATARPRLSSQEHTTPSNERVDAVLVPAEWAVFASTAPWSVAGPTLRIAAGGALPLSHRTVEDAEGRSRDETFAGVTSPRFRLVLSVHFTLDSETLDD